MVYDVGGPVEERDPEIGEHFLAVPRKVTLAEPDDFRSCPTAAEEPP